MNLVLESQYMPLLKFAEQSHHGQFRKFSGEPYVNHPYTVAKLLMSTDYFKNNDNDSKLIMVWIALHHDLIEDVYQSEDYYVAALQRNDLYDGNNAIHVFAVDSVVALTSFTDALLSRKSRIAKYNQKLSNAHHCVKLIKLLDIMHNASTIMYVDKRFATRWITEKIEQLVHLKIDDPAYNRVHDMLSNAHLKLVNTN